MSDYSTLPVGFRPTPQQETLFQSLYVWQPGWSRPMPVPTHLHNTPLPEGQTLVCHTPGIRGFMRIVEEAVRTAAEAYLPLNGALSYSGRGFGFEFFALGDSLDDGPEQLRYFDTRAQGAVALASIIEDRFRNCCVQWSDESTPDEDE